MKKKIIKYSIPLTIIFLPIYIIKAVIGKVKESKNNNIEYENEGKNNKSLPEKEMVAEIMEDDNGENDGPRTESVRQYKRKLVKGRKRSKKNTELAKENNVELEDDESYVPAYKRRKRNKKKFRK